MKKPVRQKMLSRKVCNVKSELSSADASIRNGQRREEYQKRKYRSKRVLLDEFNSVLRRVEFEHKLLIGLERVASVSFEGVKVSKYFYNVSVNAIPYRVGSLQGAIDFLSGFSAGFAQISGKVPLDGSRGDFFTHGQKMIGDNNGNPA